MVAPDKKTTRKNTTMKKYAFKPEIKGTRTGYVIRFTCPECATENLIITRTPRDNFKETRDSTCKHCRMRSTILTPSVNQPRSKSPVYPCTGYTTG
jgi:transcription elongation factor Elf1